MDSKMQACLELYCAGKDICNKEIVDKCYYSLDDAISPFSTNQCHDSIFNSTFDSAMDQLLIVSNFFLFYLLWSPVILTLYYFLVVNIRKVLRKIGAWDPFPVAEPVPHINSTVAELIAVDNKVNELLEEVVRRSQEMRRQVLRERADFVSDFDSASRR